METLTANRASRPSGKSTFTANISGQVKRVTREGREYIVAPMTLLREGVLAGSRGPLFYPASEIETNVDQWNEVPILLGHPEVDGKHVSAKHQGVVEKSGLGFIRHSHVKDGKLRAEGWFDVERAKTLDSSVVQSLEAGKPIDLSTGLFTDNEPAANDANHNGRGYTHVARRYVADHLAILPRQRGACSVSDGCGVLVNKEGTENYSPSQPRDSKGQWSGGGSGGGGGNVVGPTQVSKKGISAGFTDKSRSKKSRKRNIVQAAKELEAKGYKMEGPAAYDLVNKTARYKVKSPDGTSSVMTVKEIESLIGNKESNVPTSNQLAHDQLREQLRLLLRQRYGFTETDGPEMADARRPFVEDVFDKTFVYQYNGSLWELPYTTDLRTDKVEIDQGAPVQVRKVSSYKPVTNEEETVENASPKLLESIQDRFGEDCEIVKTVGNSVTFRQGKRLLRISYSGSGDAARISTGRPTEVEEPVQSVENQEGEGPPNINEGGSNMTDEERKGIVDSLIANCDCGWTEDDRPLLNALSEEHLERINEQSNRLAEETLIANAAREGFEDERGNSHRFNPDEKRWESVLKEVPVTNEERLTPEEKRDLAYVANLRKQKREEMIKTITSNEKNPFTAEQLAEMDDAMLVNMAKLAHVEPKQEVPEPRTNLPIWMGAGVPVGNTEPTINKHDTLDVPEIDWAAQAKS